MTGKIQFIRIVLLIGMACFLSGCFGGGGSSASGTESVAGAPNADSPFVFTPSSELFTINWEQFGEFQLPSGLSAIYMGPHMNDASLKPLTHGFTHLCPDSAPLAALANTLPSQRAILWGNTAGAPSAPIVGNQPWGMYSMPWYNDLALYQSYWSNIYLKPYANRFPDSAGQDLPQVDILCSDMEKILISDSEILALKNSAVVPPEAQQLSDAQYIEVYKKTMAALYNTAHDYVLSKGFQGQLSTYGEPPIRRKWGDIASKTWTEWTTDPSQNLTNYLLGDYNSADPNWVKQPGIFYESCDLICPSAYYFVNYPEKKSDNPSQWMGAGNYLAYLLFQVEVNRAYTDKKIIEWVYLRYHVSSNAPNQFIRPHMAEATAIFPYFAGAKGIWVYDWYSGTNGAGDPNLNYSTYEYFILGLYRLSKFKSMFEGDYTTYMPTNPRDLIVEKKPVWRGIVNHGKILVAAQNPYAEPTDLTELEIIYQGTVLGSIPLQGQETALQLFDLP